MAVTKQCKGSASEESYKILDGATVLQTSDPFANNEKRTDEFCLPASTNNQYTFMMKDTYRTSGDSWSNGAWASIAGLYGNVVFKNFMVEKEEELFTVSLYYPVLKNAEWKMTSTSSTIASGWNALGFNDAAWTSVTLGSASAVSGTQYFRITFAAIPDMAAYEYDMNYRYGIVAYVNGVEVFRDHMAEGEVTPATASDGGFTAYEYHGFIRPAGDVDGPKNALAVELHFSDATSENEVAFNAYVAALASSTPIGDNYKCYLYAYDVTLSSSSSSSPSNIFDFGKTSYYNIGGNTLPVTVTYELAGPRAHVNMLRMWPSTFVNQSPADFSLSGAMSSSSPYTTILSASDVKYQSNTYKSFFGYFSAKAYQSYRVTINSAVNNVNVFATEVQPMVCSELVPSSIVFTPNAYSVYAEYDEVTIRPDVREFTGCTLAPALPAGLTFDATTCVISGRATAALPLTTYTMSVTMADLSLQGTFSLKVEQCDHSLIKVLRVYKSSAEKESFSIKDVATQQVVLSVAADSGQTSNQEVSTYLCLSGSKYEVSVDATTRFWQSASFLYINAILFGDEYETLARMRYDANQGLAATRIVNVQWSVAPHSQWFYKMGQVPTNWYNAETAGWESSAMGSFPASTNKIQLYKKTFTVSSLNDVAGFVISLRYLYGCVIYMNGHEAFRNGVNGQLSASSTGLNAYTDLLYHQVSLPIKTLGSGSTAGVNYLVEGSNTIAIAIVAQQATQTTSYFDCALHLMGAAEVSRVFDYTLSNSNVRGSPGSILNQYYSDTLFSPVCVLNSLSVVFKNDRREWLSSVMVYLHYEQETQQVRQFTVSVRNSNLENWRQIREVTGMEWSMKGEHKKVWLLNDKPYNQYRFENFGSGDPAVCNWRLGTLDLLSDSLNMNIPDLSYPTPIVLTKSVEMGEIYPNSEYYYDFTVSPALPAGIKLDGNTGKISGTCTTLVEARAYTIQAKSFAGAVKTAVVTLSVEPCRGDKNIITLVVRTDNNPEEGSYKLFAGKGTSGEVVASTNGFKVKNGLNYADFCVPQDIYTLVVYDSAKDGWTIPAGWFLTIDVGALPFDMGQMPAKVPSMSTMFSSVIPFLVDYAEWKVWNKEEAVAADWQSASFDDAEWETKKAAELSNHMGTTAYVRHEVDIPAIEDYHVLNIRMKYAGGVVAYFNGMKVARFNLREDFDANTEAMAVHDATLFSQFHVILATVGAVTGKNMMAFEIHRASGESAVVFDASGIFGVNDCSITLDSYSAIDAPDVNGCSKEDLLTLLPTTYGNIPNAVDAYLTWTVENLEGTKANVFALQTNNVREGYSFSVDVFWPGEEESTSALRVVNEATKSRERNSWAMPVGLAGFGQFKFVVDSPTDFPVITSTYMLVYCRPETTGFCPAIGEYSGVAEGEMSPARCPEGFHGFSYRVCTEGVLGDVQMDKCEYRVPENITYANPDFVFIMGTEVSTDAPSYINIITEFFMQDSTPLPGGFQLDPKTGVISGIPVDTMDARAFTVRGRNPAGETFAEITISVIKGYCLPDGVFERTNVGQVAEYKCSSKGSYVGSQKRACVLGKTNGEWQEASGFCVPIFAMVFVVLVVIIIIVVIVLLLVRTRKTKSVGGVKGSATQKSAGKTVKSPVKV